MPNQVWFTQKDAIAVTMHQQWSDDPPSELPNVPFSHLQTLQYAAVLPRYGQKPLWSTVQLDGETIATWLFFRTPANYLSPPTTQLRRALDVHLEAAHGPVLATRLSQPERTKTRLLLLQGLVEEASKRSYLGVRVVLDPMITPEELSGWRDAASAASVSAKPSYTYAVRLPRTREELFASIKSDRRTKIRKAERRNAVFEEVETLQGVRDYYEVRCDTTTRNDLPPVPWWYFDATFSLLHPSGMYRMFLARFDERVGAGQALFEWQGYIYLAGVSLATWAREQQLPANDYLQWKVLEWALEAGHEIVDFVGAQPGSEDPKMRAIDSFKARWGTSLYESLALEYRAPSMRRRTRRAANRLVRSFGG